MLHLWKSTTGNSSCTAAFRLASAGTTCASMGKTAVQSPESKMAADKCENDADTVSENRNSIGVLVFLSVCGCVLAPVQAWQHWSRCVNYILHTGTLLSNLIPHCGDALAVVPRGTRTSLDSGCSILHTCHATHMQHTCNTHATHMQHDMQHDMQHEHFPCKFPRNVPAGVKI